MKNIGIIYNARVPEALDLSTAILHDLNLSENSWLAPAENMETLLPRAENTDLVITVGGDGTILRATTFTGPAGIPMVGINMGRLGFMTELQVHEAMENCRSTSTAVPGWTNGICCRPPCTKPIRVVPKAHSTR